MVPLGCQDFLDIASGMVEPTASERCEWQVTKLGCIQT